MAVLPDWRYLSTGEKTKLTDRRKPDAGYQATVFPVMKGPGFEYRGQVRVL